jgi:hypothetical protein
MAGERAVHFSHSLLNLEYGFTGYRESPDTVILVHEQPIESTLVIQPALPRRPATRKISARSHFTSLFPGKLAGYSEPTCKLTLLIETRATGASVRRRAI